jgi:hypothetical protein
MGIGRSTICLVHTQHVQAIHCCPSWNSFLEFVPLGCDCSERFTEPELGCLRMTIRMQRYARKGTARARKGTHAKVPHAHAKVRTHNGAYNGMWIMTCGTLGLGAQPV